MSSRSIQKLSLGRNCIQENSPRWKQKQTQKNFWSIQNWLWVVDKGYQRGIMQTITLLVEYKTNYCIRLSSALHFSRLEYVSKGFHVWMAIYHVSTWKMSRHSMELQIESSHCYISLSVGSSRKVDARFTIYTKSLGSYKRINAK